MFPVAASLTDEINNARMSSNVGGRIWKKKERKKYKIEFNKHMDK